MQSLARSESVLSVGSQASDCHGWVVVKDGRSVFAVLLPGWQELLRLCCDSGHPFLHQGFAKALWVTLAQQVAVSALPFTCLSLCR